MYIIFIELAAGNLVEIFQSQAGEVDFKWQKQYGDVVRVKGVFGVGPFLLRLMSN